MNIPFRFAAPIQRMWHRARWLMAALMFCSFASPALAAGTEAQQVTEVRPETDLWQQSVIAEGKTRFIQTCAYCHGQEGEAGKTRPFKTHTDWNPQEIFDTISNGRVRGGNVMPTWKDAISPEEIWKIVAYIKSLSASKPAVASQ